MNPNMSVYPFSATTEPVRMEEEVVGEVAMLVVALTTFASDLVAGGISWWHLLVALTTFASDSFLFLLQQV